MSYGTQCIPMVTFNMPFVMDKWTNIVMDDGWVRLLVRPYLLSSTTCDDMFSWMIKIWMKIHLVSDSIGNNVNL